MVVQLQQQAGGPDVVRCSDAFDEEPHHLGVELSGSFRTRMLCWMLWINIVREIEDAAYPKAAEAVLTPRH